MSIEIHAGDRVTVNTSPTVYTVLKEPTKTGWVRLQADSGNIYRANINEESIVPED